MHYQHVLEGDIPVEVRFDRSQTELGGTHAVAFGGVSTNEHTENNYLYIRTMELVTGDVEFFRLMPEAKVDVNPRKYILAIGVGVGKDWAFFRTSYKAGFLAHRQNKEVR